MATAAEQLEGVVLGAGWKVGPLIVKNPMSTGGNFSQSYIAFHADGRKAFVKAIDLIKAFSPGADLMQVLQRVTEEFNFEVRMVEFCNGKGMDRIVRALETGTFAVDPGPLGQVPFLIFEAADHDVRKHLDDPKNFNAVAWKLRSLHHVATGIKQLHSSQIAHQDIKPSNVLVFDSAGKDSLSKLADLGRASIATAYSPFDHMPWAGDPNYSPPEVWYGFSDPDWHRRRIAYDLYMLGSLISFLFIRVHTNAALSVALDVKFWPANWAGTFDEVLPYLNHAFAVATSTFRASLPALLANELIPIYEQLCKPDPRERGITGIPLSGISLEKFITRFDVMARKAELRKYGVT